jgi:uncharacterized protein (DUF58 family)
LRIEPQGAERGRFQKRVTAWALRRQPVDTLPLELKSRRVYILPTRTGAAFAVMLAVSFIGGLNYGNGLAMLFSFWLAGFALVAMLRTHRQLTGTQITDATAEPAFAGQTVALRLQFAARDALELQLPAPKRGRWRAPALRLETTAPFGLFRTWTWLQLDVHTLVYPAPHGNLPEPESPGGDIGGSRTNAGQDELSWLRAFREGDSPRQVAWKAYARGAPLLVREYQGCVAAIREFSFDALPGLATEARLAQLCRWVVDAAARNEAWTLVLPGSGPVHGVGGTHRQESLSRLALFNAPGSR